jgi:hypothetical protein
MLLPHLPSVDNRPSSPGGGQLLRPRTICLIGAWRKQHRFREKSKTFAFIQIPNSSQPRKLDLNAHSKLRKLLATPTHALDGGWSSHRCVKSFHQFLVFLPFEHRPAPQLHLHATFCTSACIHGHASSGTTTGKMIITPTQRRLKAKRQS